MSVPAYPAPPANRASLEQRLRNICAALGLNEMRTRTSLAHTVVAQMLPAGVVKGGAAIKLRVGDQASRVTRDLDAARAAEHTLDSYTEELSARLAKGWHGFAGRLVEREPADPPDVPAEHAMQPFDVKLSYESQSYVTIELELGRDEIGSTKEPKLALDGNIADVVERWASRHPPRCRYRRSSTRSRRSCTRAPRPTAKVAMSARTTWSTCKSS